METNRATTLDLENRWPELFVALTRDQRDRVVHGWAAQWHEGWDPNRADVALSVDYIGGRVSGDEYRRRVLAGIPAHSLASSYASAMAGLDAWNAYLWEPGGIVLRNLLGITEFDELREREYAYVFQRTDELRQGLVTIEQTFDLDRHRAVHRHLFQDVYAWAGEARTVELAKGASGFADRADVKRACDEAARVATTTERATITRANFGQAIAEIYSWMNFAHPLRVAKSRVR